MKRRGRALSVLLLLVCGGVGTISAAQTWLVVPLPTVAMPIEVPGTAAFPLLAPLSLTILALAGVLSIVNRLLRYICAAILAAIALALFAGNLPLVLDPPISAMMSTITEETGLAGEESVAQLVTGVAGTAWPLIGLVLWAGVFGAAVVIALTAHGWKAGGKRFRTDTADHVRPVDAIDSWDDLSRGTDPTAADR